MPKFSESLDPNSTRSEYDQEKLIDRMPKIETSVSRGDVASVLNLFQTTVERLCGEGYSVSLDNFVRFCPAIGGTVDSEADGYLGGRNTVYVNASVSSTFNNRFTLGATVEKTATTFKSPLLFSIEDLATETTNEKVTKANIVSVGGERLKFDEENPSEYLRFVNAADPTQFTPVTRFQRRTDKQIVFLMPEVPYTQGYFELANAMNTAKVRTERSATVEVAA